jgi:hypothetical protein
VNTSDYEKKIRRKLKYSRERVCVREEEKEIGKEKEKFKREREIKKRKRN